jgi:E3 ubiquitin-protein ligase HECTD2
VSYLLDRLEHGGGNGSEGRVESSSIEVPGRSVLREVVSGCEESRAVETVEQYIPVIAQPIHIPRRHTSELEKLNYGYDYNTIPRVYSTSTPNAYIRLPSSGERCPIVDRSKTPADGLLGPLRSKGETSIKNADVSMHRGKVDTTLKGIFGPLEDYIITSFKSRECVNSSFTTVKPGTALHSVSEGTRRRIAATVDGGHHRTIAQLSTMDAKTLLIGDFAENGSWWSGGRGQEKGPSRSRFYRSPSSTETSSLGACIVSPKSPGIDWVELSNWYRMILCAGIDWERHLNYLTEMDRGEPMRQHLSLEERREVEKRISEARIHTQRVLLKATESLLKRPGAPLREPDDIRFLLIILENPLLYPSRMQEVLTGYQNRSGSRSGDYQSTKTTMSPGLSRTNNSGPGQHSGIIKRVLGLLSNLPNECHHYLVGWFARFSESHFRENIELVGGFVTYRLTRQHGREQPVTRDHTAELIPSVGTSGRETSAALHAVLGVSSQSTKKSEDRSVLVAYSDDWQLKAAARVMALLFAANTSGVTPRNVVGLQDLADTISGSGFVPSDRSQRYGQIIPISDFYNTLLDYSDLIADFEAWETRRGKFTFCQYPFFLSIWAKIRIMEHDAHRQMEIKAREAFFDSIMTRKAVNQYLILKVRRECLVEDSLKGVSEVVGTGQEEIKKGLRIEFKGEEGIDAGGLRKEWFLLLVRDVFNPEHGVLVRRL